MRIVRDFRDRASVSAQAVLSVVLSVALAHALHLPYTWWAAISGFAVVQTTFAGSLQKVAHRILGTVIGAALGALAGPLIGDRPWLFIPAMGVIAAVTVYYGNGSRAPYAWVLGGVTALMVTHEAHVLLSFNATVVFAAMRVAEVAVGTLSCALVVSLFHFATRSPGAGHPYWPPPTGATSAASPAVATGSAPPTGATSGASPAVATGSAPPTGAASAASPTGATSSTPCTGATSEASTSSPGQALPPSPGRDARKRLCLEGALAVGILAAFAYYLRLPGFPQALVTAIAVLILPAGLSVAATRQPVIEKMVHRVAGCLLAGALGIALLPLMQGNVILCLIALSIGVWAGCHVQTGHAGASYIGRQFTIAFIMVFVQDHHWSSDPIPALMRLTGILAGIAILAMVMLAVRALDFSSSTKGVVG